MKTYEISEAAVTLAIKFLREHASVLEHHFPGLTASAEMVETLAQQIEEEVALQVPMTPEEQTAVLTKIMGCGPTDESIGNRG